jgi:hypothetical protein
VSRDEAASDLRGTVNESIASLPRPDETGSTNAEPNTTQAKATASADGKTPPHPGGCHGRVPEESQQARHKDTIIHLLEVSNAGRFLNSGSFGSLTNRVKTQSGSCAR